MKRIKGNLVLKEDTKYDESIDVERNIICEGGIWDLKVEGNINAWDINAFDINAFDINARHINAFDINASDINARHINARHINARHINALDIDAWDITYYAVCFAYEMIKCKSIEGRRSNSKHFCLDGEITFKDKDDDKIKEFESKIKDLQKELEKLR